MTLNELVQKIEGHGYQMTGRELAGRFPFDILGQRVIAAPVVLVPQEPPVEEDSVMVPDLLDWSVPIDGYARIEGAAALTNGAIVHLQFVPVARA